MPRWVAILHIVIVGLALAGSARADGVEPWQVGVSEDDKQRARTALDEGNALYIQNLYREAAAAYETALAAWNHPAIRFNLAKALIALDRPIEALDHLDAAMTYGAKPLGEVWSEAVNYKALLERQLGTLTVRCTQPGVELVVDGIALAPCPTASTARVRPGRHTIVGRKAGYLTATHDAVVVGGETATLDVTLVSLADAAVTRTRWPAWQPWLVASAGVALAGTGVLLELDARGKRDAYRIAVRDECGEFGCAGGEASPSTRALWDQARTRDRAGVTLMLLGGVGIAAGVTLIVLNRPVTSIPSDIGGPTSTGGTEVAVSPWLGGGVTGLAVTGHL